MTIIETKRVDFRHCCNTLTLTYYDSDIVLGVHTTVLFHQRGKIENHQPSMMHNKSITAFSGCKCDCDEALFDATRASIARELPFQM